MIDINIKAILIVEFENIDKCLYLINKYENISFSEKYTMKLLKKLFDESDKILLYLHEDVLTWSHYFYNKNHIYYKKYFKHHYRKNKILNLLNDKK